MKLAEKKAYVAKQKQTREHTCHWPDCVKMVPPARWGCRSHWMRLPKFLRDKIWDAYEPGQEVSMSPSARYLEVMGEVERWIEENHGHS